MHPGDRGGPHRRPGGVTDGDGDLGVNGTEVGRGRVERSVPTLFTAAETFDIGRDMGSPVALDYRDRTPFPFNGTINTVRISYI